MTEAGITHYPRWQCIWSAEEKARLRLGIERKEPIRNIAAVLGRPIKSIWDKCFDLGLSHQQQQWTDERIEHLKRLYETGYSAQESAVELGCTRNAVIGKWHRHPDLFPPRAHIVNGHSPVKKMRARGERKPRHMQQRMATLVPRFIPEEITELPTDQSPCAVTFAELEERHCRWPLATAGMSCGADKLDGCSYCSRHAARAFQSPHSRGRRHFSLRERTA